MLRPALFALIALGLAGCASDDLPQVFTPYSDEAFQSWTGPGPAHITGQAFYKMPSGRVLSCAGSAVMLMPANGYNLEALQSIGMGKGLPENYNRSAFKFTRKTVCDGSGRFRFENLPTVNWIAMTHLSWQQASMMPFVSNHDNGGTLFQEVMLQPGENKILMSNQEFVADN